MSGHDLPAICLPDSRIIICAQDPKNAVKVQKNEAFIFDLSDYFCPSGPAVPPKIVEISRLSAYIHPASDEMNQSQNGTF